MTKHATLVAGTEATFLAGRWGRDGRLALWSVDGAPADATGPRDGTHPTTVVLADGPTEVTAVHLPMEAAIGQLLAVTADDAVTPSVRAWSVAARTAVQLISRGRVLPSIARDGGDAWRLGPLDQVDRTRLLQLAAGMPPAAHAVPITIDGSFGLATATDPGEIVHGRMADPLSVLGAFLDAVADTFVRTEAAPLAAGGPAFAARRRTDVSLQETWLRSVSAATARQTEFSLRLELADDEDAPVRGVLQVQSRADPSLVMDAADLWMAPPAVAGRFGEDVETDLLLTLRAAARIWAPAGRFLNAAIPGWVDLDPSEVDDLFGPLADDLAGCGLAVLWPAEVLRPVELYPTVELPGDDERTGASGQGRDEPRATRLRLDLRALGEIRWRATVDGTDLTDDELLQLADAKRSLVRLRGTWVRADPERLRRLHERTPITVGHIMRAASAGELEIDDRTVAISAGSPLAALARRLRGLHDAPARAVPAALAATLRAYQERGLSWLAEMAELGLGGVLADDMGLGKTIQVIALHLERVHDGPTLVVCPASLMGNWEREVARFAPQIPVRRYHGSDRSLEGLGPEDVVVTTYGMVRRDATRLADIPWAIVVADEAQAVKNPDALVAKALRRVPSVVRFALTGTPVENRLSDLWALLDWTTPGLLGDRGTFQRRVATPIEQDGDEEVAADLAALVAPFLLRRRKTDPGIAPDLPPKTETNQFVGLTVEQATLYRAAVDELIGDLGNAPPQERSGRVLQLLTALKQICNHPAQYLGQTAPLEHRSGKFDATMDLVDAILDEGDSCLVFTQFVVMGRLLVTQLEELDLPVKFLSGSTPIGRRQQLVDEFQSGPPTAFVISLGAGGTGLNLTRATHVVHYDRWWNPAVEDQASDRAWRIGQDRPVQVHRMICERTLEERIAELSEAKRELADSVIGSGESWLSSMDPDELLALVQLGRDAAGAGGRS